MYIVCLPKTTLGEDTAHPIHFCHYVQMYIIYPVLLLLCIICTYTWLSCVNM